MFKLIDKKIITILLMKILLIWTYVLWCFWELMVMIYTEHLCSADNEDQYLLKHSALSDESITAK